jgi:hypothetical protein
MLIRYWCPTISLQRKRCVRLGESGLNDIPRNIGSVFRSRLDQIIDMKHALVKLARAIDWGFLKQTFGAVYTDKPGQVRRATRVPHRYALTIDPPI